MLNRIPKVNALIRNELNEIILKEIDFPEGVLVTITRVETAANLNQSKIYVSVFPSQKTSAVFNVLDKAVYEIQQKVNKRLKMRPVPRLKFEKEAKSKEAGRIEEILEEIKNQEENS